MSYFLHLSRYITSHFSMLIFFRHRMRFCWTINDLIRLTWFSTIYLHHYFCIYSQCWYCILFTWSAVDPLLIPGSTGYVLCQSKKTFINQHSVFVPALSILTDTFPFTWFSFTLPASFLCNILSNVFNEFNYTFTVFPLSIPQRTQLNLSDLTCRLQFLQVVVN